MRGGGGWVETGRRGWWRRPTCSILFTAQPSFEIAGDASDDVINHDYFFAGEYKWNIPAESSGGAYGCDDGGFVDLDPIESDLAGSRADGYLSPASSAPRSFDDVSTIIEPTVASPSSSEDPSEKSTVTDGAAADTPSSETPSKAKTKGQKRVRQQRFAFVTKSEVDHLEDGYRWRKYGQKAVKNSPFPRSYYRCTNSKCMVKKRVERSCDDPSVVITTYEGQHSHHSVGFPRGGLIIPYQESAFARHVTPFDSQFYHPRLQFPQQNSLHNTQSPQNIQGKDGLLGDIVPPGMRN
ncbi:hypothetical protein BUALT_Bualt05G0144000 [Buddleja alternifolia]|uniref:WRKY domain-containing protein n=1 Tax=Buddleja alternifolia TaxID=168488 RepID=A0AAV6XVA4_9LAMI|nr:hypothetical protein BUALT_Bualt05G0144000 [Buddleja alternifolia]